MERKIITGLHTSEYEHSLDKVALEALRKIPVVPKLLELCSVPMNYVDRINRAGSQLRVSENQMPTIYNMLLEACKILEIDEPILYIQNGKINATASNPDKPVITLYSHLIDVMTEEELMFIIGHELAHIKSQHLIYQQLGLLLSTGILTTVLKTIPGAGLLTPAVNLALTYAYWEWSRAAEYTCDRGGFLACQNYEASCSALMKLSGFSYRYKEELNLDAFMEQGEKFQDLDKNGLNVIAKVYLSTTMSHPWTVLRVQKLMEFKSSGQYEDILNRKKTDVNSSGKSANKCAECGAELLENANFCVACGYQSNVVDELLALDKSGVKCIECGAVLSNDAKFCNECGAKVIINESDVKCTNCGAKLKNGTKFCVECGFKTDNN